MRTLQLTDKMLAALRMEFCAGLTYPDQKVRAALYDEIDKAHREMQQGKAGTIDGKDGRAAPDNPADEITVSERERRVRRA